LVVISLVGTISGKSIELLPSDVILKLKCTTFDFVWGSLRRSSKGKEGGKGGKGGEGKGLKEGK